MKDQSLNRRATFSALSTGTFNIFFVSEHILVPYSCKKKNSSVCKNKRLFFHRVKYLAPWLLILTPISFLNFVPNPQVLSCDSVSMFFFVCGVNVSQITFERDFYGDTGVGISTGQSVIGILGVCIDSELSDVKDR